MKIYNWIYRTTNEWKKSKIGLMAYECLDELRLRGAINRYVHWKKRKDILSVEEIKINREFWAGKSKEIERIAGLLYDEESRCVLRSMIRYRCSGEYKDLPSNSFSTQYFINDFFSYNEGECYIDGGAFDGDTIIRFKRLMRKKKIHKYLIVAFEPDHESFVQLSKAHKDVYCINKGLYSKNAILSFDANNSLTSSLVTDTEGKDEGIIDRVEVTSIDNCSKCKNATFIKMDIEGAEYEALLGAKETIIRNTPKLAICIYHSNEDMLRIIELVNSINPNYKLFVRQHTNALCETVLYAVK